MALKQYFDNAKTASDDLAKLKNEIETLYNSGNDEDLAKAVELSDGLDAATKKANELNKLYLSMRDAENTTGSAASLFVNAEDDEEPEGEGKKNKKELNREEFNNLQPVDRLAFINAGGNIVE